MKVLRKRTTTVLLAVLAIALSATLVSAALLTYFGKVNTTMTAQQSIVISDGSGWKNWNEPVSRDLGNVIHCTDYCHKMWIKNQACKPATVSLTDICTAAPYGDPSGVDKSYYVFGDSQTIQLIQKQVVFGQSPWLPLPKGIEATLTFNTCGQTMNWNIVSNADLTGYSLIYYANYPQYWTEGPVTVLGSGLSGTANVPTMPATNDENALRSINLPPIGENYEHAYGAKFWFVPTASLIQVQNGWDVNWGMAGQFLFETDLGFYMDCDNMQPTCLSNVYPIFDTTTLQPLSTYCWISCYHVAFNIMPGIYSFETTVNAQEVPSVSATD